MMTDQTIEVKKDMEQLNKLLRRLHLLKEQEITLYRSGKRLPTTGIKQMREMEATITALMNRRRLNLNAHQRAHLENFKNKYQASMRSWQNRISFTDLRKKRKFKRQQRLGQEMKGSGAAVTVGKPSTNSSTD